MSEALAGHLRAQRQRQQREAEEKAARKAKEPVHPALRKLRQEAQARGATLASGGEGGLPAEVVLQVMRRDSYRCKKCGLRANLSVHHKAEHLENPSPKLVKMHKRISKTDPDGIVTICESCHDLLHDADRANVEGN